MELQWNAPYLDHRVWLLEHLDMLHVDTKEALTLMIIDLLNQTHEAITHEKIAKKLKISVEEVEELFLSLSEKGYLSIDFKDGQLIFDIEGIFTQGQPVDLNVSRSIIQEFEEEFGRSLSATEMQRVLDMCDQYDQRRVLCALNEAASYDKRNMNYIEQILMSWMQKNLSIEDVENGKR